jgi:hypothetical protein
MSADITRAALAIQCKATTGEFGTFLYVPTAEGKEPISPVFPGLMTFYPWARREGWRNEEPYNVACLNYVRTTPATAPAVGAEPAVVH